MNVKRELYRFWLSPAMSGAIIPSIVLLIIRLAWGWELVESGWGHWHPITGFAETLWGWGIPHPKISARITATTELVGGALVMLGLATRFAAFPLIINFCVAYVPNSSEVTQFFKQDPANFINDTAFPFLIVSLLLFALGAGVWSVDGMINLLLDKRPLTFWQKLKSAWWLPPHPLKTEH